MEKRDRMLIYNHKKFGNSPAFNIFESADPFGQKWHAEANKFEFEPALGGGEEVMYRMAAYTIDGQRRPVACSEWVFDWVKEVHERGGDNGKHLTRHLTKEALCESLYCPCATEVVDKIVDACSLCRFNETKKQKEPQIKSDESKMVNEKTPITPTDIHRSMSGSTVTPTAVRRRSQYGTLETPTTSRSRPPYSPVVTSSGTPIASRTRSRSGTPVTPSSCRPRPRCDTMVTPTAVRSHSGTFTSHDNASSGLSSLITQAPQSVDQSDLPSSLVRQQSIVARHLPLTTVFEENEIAAGVMKSHEQKLGQPGLGSTEPPPKKMRMTQIVKSEPSVTIARTARRRLPKITIKRPQLSTAAVRVDQLNTPSVVERAVPVPWTKWACDFKAMPKCAISHQSVLLYGMESTTGFVAMAAARSNDIVPWLQFIKKEIFSKNGCKIKEICMPPTLSTMFVGQVREILKCVVGGPADLIVTSPPTGDVIWKKLGHFSDSVSASLETRPLMQLAWAENLEVFKASVNCDVAGCSSVAYHSMFSSTKTPKEEKVGCSAAPIVLSNDSSDLVGELLKQTDSAMKVYDAVYKIEDTGEVTTLTP